MYFSDSTGMNRRSLLRLGGTLALASVGSVVIEQTPIVRAQVLRSNSVLLWNKALLQAIRDSRTGPSIAARALAMVHTAIYDAWAAYEPVAVGVYLGETYRRPTSERSLIQQQCALSYAAFRTLSDLFPGSISLFQLLMAQLGYDATNTSLDVHSAVGIGNLAARTLLEARHNDGSNQLGNLHPGAYSDYTNYVPVNTVERLNDPAHWQPLRVSDGHGGFVVQIFTTPQWPRVKPFALISPTQFRTAQALPAADSQAYIEQAQQMLDYSANLTDTQKTIADYWRDSAGTEQPCGHWMLFAHYISQRDKHTLGQDVELFFALGSAMLDASIACWDDKCFFDSVRPITAIHYLFAHKKVRAWAGPHLGTRLIDGQDWQPYQPSTLVTPPFPEFCSGHSTFSAAGAEVLRSFTGSDGFGASFTRLAGTSMLEPGTAPATNITFSWPTFSAAAEQAGLSRRYGGIHFPYGDLMGRALGRAVGSQAWQRARAYMTGSVDV